MLGCLRTVWPLLNCAAFLSETHVGGRLCQALAALPARQRVYAACLISCSVIRTSRVSDIVALFELAKTAISAASQVLPSCNVFAMLGKLSKLNAQCLQCSMLDARSARSSMLAMLDV